MQLQNRIGVRQQSRKLTKPSLLARLIATTVALMLPFIGAACGHAQKTPEVIAYIFPREEPLSAAQIDARKLTRINYAFGTVDNGNLLAASKEEAGNLATLVSLKQVNPALKVLISIGGWDGSKNFSDAVLTASSRAAFATSVVTHVHRYRLDGVDIDWEYPGMVGAGNTFRLEDAQHFTEFLKLLRAALDSDTRPHAHALITIAAGATPAYLAHADLRGWQPYLDTVNLMSYDYREPTDSRITGNHAPLFDDPADLQPMSVDQSIRSFEAAGVPASKLVVGVPFYGHVWANVSATHHGLFQPGSAPQNGYAPYSLIASKWIEGGYVRYWDDAAKAPYLYNDTTKEFVSYEDPESLALKCAYIKHHNLAGIMFWELLGDDKGRLLQTIDSSFHPASAAITKGQSE